MPTESKLLRVVASIAVASLLVSREAGAEPLTAEIPRPPKFVAAEDWGSRPDAIPEERRHTPRRIMLHHAGVRWTTDRDPVEFLRNMQSWGKRRPEIEQPPRNTYWPDLPYHFLIAPDGRIFEGRPLDYEPESNTKYELAGHLGLELMGNFEVQRPSPSQVESAVRLVAWLLGKYDLSTDAITTHAKAAKGQTSCPGRDFARYCVGEESEFAGWVAAVLRGDEPTIELGPPLEEGPTELITESGPIEK